MKNIIIFNIKIESAHFLNIFIENCYKKCVITEALSKINLRICILPSINLKNSNVLPIFQYHSLS
jgi:hypothetical protein